MVTATHQMSTSYRVKSFLASTNHKDIGILYFIFAITNFSIGGLFALLIRIQLALPNSPVLTPD